MFGSALSFTPDVDVTLLLPGNTHSKIKTCKAREKQSQLKALVGYLHVFKAQHAFIRVVGAVASTHWLVVAGAHGQVVLGTVSLLDKDQTM